jgi:hypothetical protein
LQFTLQKILYSFPVVLLWVTCACCNWRHNLQRLSPQDYGLRHDNWWSHDYFSNQISAIRRRKRPTIQQRMNGHRSDLTKKTLLPVSQHFVSPVHSLDDFVRSKIDTIDHNPSWKENQDIKERDFGSASYKLTSGGHKQKGLNLLFFNFLTSAWSLASW